MAVDDQRGLIGAGAQILKLAGHRAHGNQRGAFDFRLRELMGLADIDQMEFFTGIETPFDFLWIYF